MTAAPKAPRSCPCCYVLLFIGGLFLLFFYPAIFAMMGPSR